MSLLVGRFPLDWEVMWTMTCWRGEMTPTKGCTIKRSGLFDLI